MGHSSIAEKLSEFSLPHGCLLIDGLELFLDGLVASGSVPRFSRVVLLDQDSNEKMTACSFGQAVKFSDEARL